MSTVYNIYCDESCHLENDKQQTMLLGGIWCPKAEAGIISKRIRDLKARYNARGELKWVKVSPSRQAFYLELVDYFFSTPALHFRCLAVDDKSRLNHAFFNQGSHDSFYYKMYFYMLRNVLHINNQYYIYLDIKDSRSAQKVAKLKDILCNNVYDFTQEMIACIQNIRSHESEILQLADFFIGAVSYQNRDLATNNAKIRVIERITEHVGQNLHHSSPPWEEKFNLFIFSPSEVR